MNVLKLADFREEIEEIEPGDTLRVDHTTCDAGEDTRRRLYITRTLADPTVVVGYCHNCQEGSRWRTDTWKGYRYRRHEDHTTWYHTNVEKVLEEIVEPAAMVQDPNLWPSIAQAWLYNKAKLSHRDVQHYGIQYDVSSNRIYLPRYDEFDWNGDASGSALIGYQLRGLDKGSKYLTVSADNSQPWTELFNSEYCIGDYAIIVEDLASAIHIIKATTEDKSNGPIVFVNYGTKVDPAMMHSIASRMRYTTVWLDNDNQHVVNQARLMERTIKMYSSNVFARTEMEHDDPKNHSPAEITRILDEVWN